MSDITLRGLEGKYEILGKLREGGMGAIYKVRHRLLDEVRVVKTMRPQLVESEELKSRFLREARFAIKLRHTNIAEIYDFTVDESDGTAYIVLEFIEGRTFEDLIAQSELPPLRLTLELAQQSLRALGYLHAKGFIHRDISPDNLMVTVDPEGQPLVKLIDLGIARVLGGAGDGLTQAGTFLGKVRYAPPEQFQPEGSKADARGDLYSFGIVLYGRYPILGKDLSSLIAGHLFHAPLGFAESDPDSRVPPTLREVVLKSIAKKAEERFASAQEFARALAAFRAPGDLTHLDLGSVLNRVASPTLIVPTGSTQERLNEQFRLETTPPRGRLDAAEIEAGRERRTEERQPPLKEEKSREAKAEELVASACRSADQGDFKSALRDLRKAEKLDPGSSGLRTLIEQTEERSKRQMEEKRRAERIAKASAAIAARLDAGDLEQAARLLSKAAAEFPGAEDFGKSFERLTDLRRASEVQAAVSQIEAALEQRDLGAASGLLDRAVARLGAEPALRAMWERLEGLRRAEHEHRTDDHPSVT